MCVGNSPTNCVAKVEAFTVTWKAVSCCVEVAPELPVGFGPLLLAHEPSGVIHQQVALPSKIDHDKLDLAAAAHTASRARAAVQCGTGAVRTLGCGDLVQV